MASRYSTNNIHNKLRDLTIDSAMDSLPEQTETVAAGQDLLYSTKSLLSNSLKGDKYTSTPPQLQKLLMEELTRNLTDEHPEPELLATSVGKDNDGRLIPSSSTISLLSLSNNAASVSTNYLDVALLPKQGVPAVVPAMAPAVGPVPTAMDLRNSYNNIRSRNSLTHLHQQRLQPYHKLTSPTVASNAEFITISSPQNIPMARNQGIMTPDSPNLDPTSLGGSPSRFWLNSQTPPRSLLNSFSKSRTHIFPHTQLHSQLGPGQPTAVHSMALSQQNHTSVGSKHSVSKAININKSGGDSPVLNPVQTPLEDFPMTPLFLNGGGDNYFVLTNGQAVQNHHNSREYQHNNQEFDEMEENEYEDDYSMMDASNDT